MRSTRIYTSFFLLAAVACVPVTAPQPVASQQPPARIPYTPFKQIHVDQQCRILPDPNQPFIGKKKPRPFRDPVVCQLESVATSEHMEEAIVGHELQRSQVNISEQGYILQNITSEHIVFVVEELVPDGWIVDSNPRPVAMEGQTAIFYAHAEPGEIVRMHVGLRHTKPLRPKLVKAPPLPSSSSNGS